MGFSSPLNSQKDVYTKRGATFRFQIKALTISTLCLRHEKQKNLQR